MQTPPAPDWARREAAIRPEPAVAAGGPGRRVTLVGPCAAGKSSLAAALRARGFDAHICAQEHSEVPHLWALSKPEVLVYLSVQLDAIRARRADPSWPASIYAQQQRRLGHALAHCDVYVDTTRRDQAGVLAATLAGIMALTGQTDDASTAGFH